MRIRTVARAAPFVLIVGLAAGFAYSMRGDVASPPTLRASVSAAPAGAELASAPPVLSAPISSNPATMLGMVDFKRRSTSEITMHAPHRWGDRLVRAWNRLDSLPPDQQPSAHQQWMAAQVHEAINEALGKVGYQASERNLSDGIFYVIEKKRKTP